MMLKRSQLLGRNTIYNGRFKKKLITADKLTPFSSGIVEDILRHPLNGKPLMVVRTETNQTLRLPAVKGVTTGTVFTRDMICRLSELPDGSTVCSISNPQKNITALVAAGSKGILSGKKGDKYMVRIGRRMVHFPDSYCFKGSIAGADAHIKPIMKAGVAYKMRKAGLKKYPKVSSHKMNVHESQTGGSSRKKRGAPTCVARNASPGSKCGNIAATRTGRRR